MNTARILDTDTSIELQDSLNLVVSKLSLLSDFSALLYHDGSLPNKTINGMCTVLDECMNTVETVVKSLP